jgi:hypothetical protein
MGGGTPRLPSHPRFTFIGAIVPFGSSYPPSIIVFIVFIVVTPSPSRIHQLPRTVFGSILEHE